MNKKTTVHLSVGENETVQLTQRRVVQLVLRAAVLVLVIFLVLCKRKKNSLQQITTCLCEMRRLTNVTRDIQKVPALFFPTLFTFKQMTLLFHIVTFICNADGRLVA